MLASAGIADMGSVYLDRATPRIEGETVQGVSLFLQYERQLRRRTLREAAAEAHLIVADQSVDSSALARIGMITARPIWRLRCSFRRQSRAAPIELEVRQEAATPGYLFRRGGRDGMIAAGRALAACLAGQNVADALACEGFRQVSGTS